jgi:hypothetical protein
VQFSLTIANDASGGPASPLLTALQLMNYCWNLGVVRRTEPDGERRVNGYTKYEFQLPREGLGGPPPNKTKANKVSATSNRKAITGDGRGNSYTVFMFPIELAKRRYVRLEGLRHRYIEETYVKELFGLEESDKKICIQQKRQGR